MPYCYVEDMSIVALVCVCVSECERKNESLSSPGALFSLKQYSVLWAFLSVVQLLPMSVRCDSDRSRIPVRKALLIIPAGGWMCVRVCVCVCVCE